MATSIITLYQRMYQLTRPECDKCRVPRSCCSPEYCQRAIEIALERYGETLEPVAEKDRIRPDVLFLSKERGGCVVPPHMRPDCTFHTCDINAFGFKRNDLGDEWTKRYFKLRAQINNAEVTRKFKHQNKRGADAKIALIEKWSDWYYDHTKSFADTDLGMQLSYLWAAILQDTVCQFAETDEVITLLRREEVPQTADIWNYIKLLED